MNIYLAQNLPTNDQPIQRTIEEENSDGLVQSQITPEIAAKSDSQKEVVFGLVAVLLVIIAIVAAAVLWKNGKS